MFDEDAFIMQLGFLLHKYRLLNRPWLYLYGSMILFTLFHLELMQKTGNQF